MTLRAPANTPPPLVDREHELAMLWQAFGAAVKGGCLVALAAGEPGIGKTHLLDAFAERAEAAGAAVLRGEASDAAGMPPYLPFLEALGRHVRTAPAGALAQQVGPHASVLVSMLPELALRLGEIPAGYALPAEQARLRLYEAVGELLAAIAAPSGLVLILDDLHWADPATLDLLCHVARHQTSARLLILGAYRAGEADEHAALGHAVAELNRLRTLTSVTVGALAAANLAVLAANYLGAPIASQAVERLMTHSEGVPFFAEELLRDWQETGVLIYARGRWTLNPAIEPSLPAGIAGAIRQRLSRLEPEVLELLGSAAIIGRSFDLELLAAVAGHEPEPVEAHLRRAERARLIASADETVFRFSHDKIRECLYHDMSATRRRRLHGFIGRALEARATSPDGQQLASLAFHFAQSGDRARGGEYALLAAGQARRAYAPDEARSQYQAALDLIEAADPRRGEILLTLAEAASLAGDEQEAARALEAARVWFRQAGDTLAAAQAARRLGQVWWRQEAIGPARAAFEEALVLLAEQPCPELVKALIDLGSLLAVSLHEQAAGIAHCKRALDLARDMEDGPLLAAASRALGNLLVRANDLPSGIRLLEQALALAQAADDVAEAAECCGCLAPAYFWQGSVRQSAEVTRLRLEMARRSHDPYALRHVYAWLAVCVAMHGNLSEAARLLDQAQALVERLSTPEPRAYVEFARGGLAYLRGDSAAALSHFQEAITTFRSAGPGALVWYLGFLGLAQMAAGDEAGARSSMDELEGLLAGVPADTMPYAEPLAYLSALALALDECQRLTRYYPRLLAFEGQFHDLLIDRLLGQIETLHGDWAGAESHLAAAEAAARREGLAAELAATLEAQAELALAQAKRAGEDVARASILLRQALTLVEGLGNQPEAQRLAGRLHMLDQRHGSRRRIVLPAGLTTREAEVLRLVVTGKSNRQIAADLVLSERTVENHLTRIYGKAGVDNRAAAAAFAIRHGLA